MDMVEELEMERRADEPYALCNDGPTAEILTPLFIFKSFIVQLLNAHLEEATAPKHHRRLSTQTFETIGQSMEDTYKLLAEALKMIDNDGGPKFQGHPVHRSSRIMTFRGERSRQSAAPQSTIPLKLWFRTAHVILTSQYPTLYSM